MKNKMKKKIEPSIFFEAQNMNVFLNRGLIFIFLNCHINNFVSTLPNVVKIFVENDNVVSTLSNVISTFTYTALFQR